MTVVTWRLQLKVTHLFHRRAKVVQMKPGTFCTTLSVSVMTYVYVCVRCSMYVLSVTAADCVSWWLQCLSCMSHSTHLSFLGCPCHDEFFSTSGLVHTNILQVYFYLNIRTFTHMHKLNQSSCEQQQDFLFFFFLFFWYNKYEGYRNLPYSNTDYLSDYEIKAV